MNEQLIAQITQAVEEALRAKAGAECCAPAGAVQASTCCEPQAPPAREADTKSARTICICLS